MATNSSPDSLRPTAPMSPPPPIDLKHMTSATALISPSRDHRSGNRTSQHLRTADARLGSRSPNSIPSSPTSVRSSSSAIFERDIEPIVPPSPPSTHHHPTNPHRIPRAKGTEQLEQSVPSVLDSAASILTGLEDVDVAEQVAVVAPASSTFDAMGRSSGFASPIGSFRSRSPSPLGSRAGAGQARAELLLSIPHPNQPPHTISSPTSVLGLQNMTSPTTSPPATSSLSTGSPSRPQIKPADASVTISQVSIGNNNITGDVSTGGAPSIVTSVPDYASITSSVDASEESSPITTTQEHPPNHLASPGLSPLYTTSALASPQSLISSPIASPSSAANNLSHPPSPVHVAKKRLSFMSYSDLISSTPATMQTLSSLTTCASTAEPPPHIPSVSGLNIASAMQAQQQSNSATPSLHGFSLVPTGGLTHAGKRDSIAMLDNLGGEWERQGLGRGLEERLEALVLPNAGSAVSVAQPVAGGKA
ncbi:hypothetical protein BDZ97DRAFT_1919011 [Flammula alnicola]|nr:hypothetical protein BDZ97DRAFT_1919011 [Flammula alnicola]